MLKKTVNYTNFDDVACSETLYFNLTEAELMEWQLSDNGGLAGYIQGIIDTNDQAKAGELFKKVLLKSYGEKSSDGKYFMKSEEISKRFECSPAYSVLYMELISDAKAASDFVNGLLPKSLVERVNQENSRQMIAPAN